MDSYILCRAYFMPIYCILYANLLHAFLLIYVFKSKSHIFFFTRNIDPEIHSPISEFREH